MDDLSSAFSAMSGTNPKPASQEMQATVETSKPGKKETASDLFEKIKKEEL